MLVADPLQERYYDLSNYEIRLLTVTRDFRDGAID